jgi:hypothetical protein
LEAAFLTISCTSFKELLSHTPNIPLSLATRANPHKSSQTFVKPYLYESFQILASRAESLHVLARFLQILADPYKFVQILSNILSHAPRVPLNLEILANP